MNLEKRTDHSILIINIRPYQHILIEKLREQITHFNVRDDDFENLFDYCIAMTLQSILELFVKGRVLNLEHNDLFRILFDAVAPTFSSVIQSAMRGYNLVLKPNEQIKVMSTFDEMIIIRYY